MKVNLKIPMGYKVYEEKLTIDVNDIEKIFLLKSIRIRFVILFFCLYVEKNKDIYEELYREIDICRYVLQKEMKSVMVYDNGNPLRL